LLARQGRRAYVHAMTWNPLDFARAVLIVQAIVYLVTGVWAVASRTTFERVTGPKTDYWLVRTVGLLVIVIGIALLAGSRAAPIGGSTWVLGIGSAAAFAIIDVRFGLPGRISRIYLLDAVFEIVIALALLVAWWRLG
jgi:hypothetical protein